MSDEPETTDPADSFSIYIARQPTFDRDMNVFGYELLFRDALTDDVQIADPDTATAKVLTHATSEFEIDALLDGKLAFINFSRNLLLDAPAFDKTGFVIEVGPELEIDQELTDSLQHLHSQGYQICLDGYAPGSSREALLPYASYAALDTQKYTPQQFEEAYESFRTDYPQIKLIAEKIESAKLIKVLWTMGLDAFRGYFFCRPEIVQGARIPDNKIVVLKLLNELRQEEVSMDSLKEILIRDSGLSYKLLRLVNSAAFRRASSVESIGHALSMLGLERIRSWVSMLALCDLGDKPLELQHVAMTRARACELVAEAISANQEQYFTLGLFSLLDAFFDRPMDELMQSVSLADEIATALTRREGTMGVVLDSVIYQERGRWQDIDQAALEELGASVRTISDAYLHANEWARETASQIQAEA